MPNGTDLRTFYYGTGTPSQYQIPTSAKTAKPTSGSLYLDDQYTKGSSVTPLTEGQVPLLTSTAADTISATTTSSTATNGNNSGGTLTAAYGLKIFAATTQSATPSLQLNSGNDSISATALLSPSTLVSGFSKVTYFYLTGLDNSGSIYGGTFNGSTQSTNTGNDSVTGTGTYRGIANNSDAVLSLGDGDDKVNGTSGSTNIVGSAAIYNAGSMDLGVSSGTITDNDALTATGSYVGLYNTGNLSFGNGTDTLTAKAATLFEQQTGVYNTGLISFGSGNDTLTSSGYTALYNSGTIGFDTGSDKLTATGTYFGIVNDVDAVITFGDNGTITPVAARSITTSGAISGLKNNGSIFFEGTGADTLTVSKGGITGDIDDVTGLPYGRLFLGKGNDKLVGFGTGVFDGGDGVDSFTLPSNTAYSGIYKTVEIDNEAKNYFVLTGTQNVTGIGYFTDFVSYQNGKTLPTVSLGQEFYLTISASGAPTVSLLPADWV